MAAFGTCLYTENKLSSVQIGYSILEVQIHRCILIHDWASWEWIGVLCQAQKCTTFSVGRKRRTMRKHWVNSDYDELFVSYMHSKLSLDHLERSLLVAFKCSSLLPFATYTKAR